MLSLTNIFGNFLKNKKTEYLTVKNDQRVTPRYGDDLFCARYYDTNEVDYFDLYIPLKGPVGIWMSGGADSSLLTFLLAKTIKDYNLNVKILPMSFKRDNKPWNLAVATNVVEKIEQILEIQKGEIFLNHNYSYFGNHEVPDFKEKLSKHIESLKHSNIVTIVYSGITKNPDPLPEELIDGREFIRDNPDDRTNNLDKNHTEEYLISSPLIFLTKEFVANLYKKHNLLDSLLPYTRSCEGLIRNTKFFKKSCETCWWCRERKWAFGKYKDDPLLHITPSDKMVKMCSVV